MRGQAVLLLTRRNDRTLTALVQDDRLQKVQLEKETGVQVGDIYIGKIRNLVQNIDAAFVDIGGGTLCFLPLARAKKPILTNRVYDGTLKAGDELAVQIVREAIKTKEAACETNLSFAGRYAVVTTQDRRIGFSGKLSKERKKELSGYLEPFFQDFPYGAVIRTNAGTLTDDSVLVRELETLREQADELLRTAGSRTCFSKLSEAPPLWLSGLRDTYGALYDRIVTDEPEFYERIQDFFDREYPAEKPEIVLYQDPMLSLSALYGLESKLAEALDKKVWLRSGGYLVIEQTEALTVIDVNTGKNIKKQERSVHFRELNLEACDEIARQLILRNLSGIIVVDFINLDTDTQKKELLKYLSALVAKDAVRTEVVDMTALGLVELTRKKISKSLAEQLKD